MLQSFTDYELALVVEFRELVSADRIIDAMNSPLVPGGSADALRRELRRRHDLHFAARRVRNTGRTRSWRKAIQAAVEVVRARLFSGMIADPTLEA